MSKRKRLKTRKRKLIPARIKSVPVLHATYPVRAHRFKDTAQSGASYFPINDGPGTGRLIQVRAGMSIDQERYTIWHEWFHCAFHEYGRPDLCASESLVEAMALGIMRVRNETPWL